MRARLVDVVEGQERRRQCTGTSHQDILNVCEKGIKPDVGVEATTEHYDQWQEEGAQAVGRQ